MVGEECNSRLFCPLALFMPLFPRGRLVGMFIIIILDGIIGVIIIDICFLVGIIGIIGVIIIDIFFLCFLAGIVGRFGIRAEASSVLPFLALEPVNHRCS